jgi:hypothetical protein
VPSNAKFERGLGLTVIATNHPGLGKATKIHLGLLDPSLVARLDRDLPRSLFPNDEPFMVRTAALRVALRDLGSAGGNHAEVQMVYPGLGRVLQELCGVTGIWLDGRETAEDTVRRISRRMLTSGSAGCQTIMFPEGGTTGKRLRGDPMELEPFRSGFVAVARVAGASILPVVQVVDVSGPILVKFLEPVKIDDWATMSDRETADMLRRDMQLAISDELRARQLANS